mmetsp:Transcript_56412/g.106154  ORF Transcript_56412/g.106154 Transcript_56412/m.106154 type:complete len:795 (+) Transcript_56412:28-2412(+)
MLPAIVFIFSRAGCDEAAKKAARARSYLLSTSEESEVMERIEFFREANAELALDSERLEWLSRGVAAHHAGLLPIEKSFIESLFQDNLIKVVFATETLAAGINMPARCTVLTKLTKWSDEGQVLLTPSSTLQMAGRAGRRGKDELGQVVFCRTPQEDAETAYKLLLEPPEPIESHFFVTYGSAVKMLRVWNMEECKSLVERSFGTYLAEKQENTADKRIILLEEQLCEYEAMFYDIPQLELEEYAKVHDTFTRAEKHKLVLKKAESNLISQTMEGILPFVPTGTSVRLTDGSLGIILDEAQPEIIMNFRTGSNPIQFNSMPFLLLVRTGEQEASDHVQMTEDARAAGSERTSAPVLSLRIIEPRHVLAFDSKRKEPPPPSLLRTILDDLPPAKKWVPRRDGSLVVVLKTVEMKAGPFLSMKEDEQKDGAVVALADEKASQILSREDAAAALSSHIVSVPYPEPSAIVVRQEKRIEKVRDQLTKLPLHSLPNREAMVDAYLKHADLMNEHTKLSKELGMTQNDGETVTWKQFKSTCHVLQAYGALDENWAPTEFGNLVGGLAGVNELWLALVLVELNKRTDLTAPQLAGTLAAVLNENLRSDVYINYVISDEVDNTLDSLEDVGMKLYDAQGDHGVEFPILMTPEACPLVEAWAAGDEWENLLEQTSLDSGDIVRIFRQVIDLLYRVQSVPYVSKSITRLAWEARFAMDRLPISEETKGLKNDVEPVEVGEAESDEPVESGEEDADDPIEVAGDWGDEPLEAEEETDEVMEVGEEEADELVAAVKKEEGSSAADR